MLTTDSGEVIGEIARGIGTTTNNVAEYRALIAGLELALEHGVTDIAVHVDSELVVHQVSGEWKIRNDALRHHAVEARRLLGKFSSWTLNHVQRERNADADRLANQGMDAAQLDAHLDAEAAEADTTTDRQGPRM